MASEQLASQGTQRAWVPACWCAVRGKNCFVCLRHRCARGRIALAHLATFPASPTESTTQAGVTSPVIPELRMQASFLVIAALRLIAAFLGILNVGLSAVRERTAELAIRRAVGARRSQVALVMFLKALIFAGAASVLASPISAAVVPVISQTFDAPAGIAAPAFPLEFTMLGGVIGVSTAILGSLLPVARALRIPIAAAIQD